MNDAHSPLDRALAIPEHDQTPYARHQAITSRLADALEAQDWAAAQVYALLMIAEQMPHETVHVTAAVTPSATAERSTMPSPSAGARRETRQRH
ncbi:MAG TPA: hypothetical protein VEH31_15480 [Streptosporangiaceae bacterium]|nr:hypothetical protein [Streptosporangiaceae bacterium]